MRSHKVAKANRHAFEKRSQIEIPNRLHLRFVSHVGVASRRYLLKNAAAVLALTTEAKNRFLGVIETLERNNDV